MAKGALFIGWGPAIAGREGKALQVFQEALQYHTRLQQQGQIESFEPFLLEPHGGDLVGFVLLRGDQEKLNRLRIDPDFIHLNTRAQLVVSNFGVVAANTGEELQRMMGDWGKNAAELA